jgi:hypothetical protein
MSILLKIETLLYYELMISRWPVKKFNTARDLNLRSSEQVFSKLFYDPWILAKGLWVWGEIKLSVFLWNNKFLIIERLFCLPHIPFQFSNYALTFLLVQDIFPVLEPYGIMEGAWGLKPKKLDSCQSCCSLAWYHWPWASVSSSMKWCVLVKINKEPCLNNTCYIIRNICHYYCYRPNCLSQITVYWHLEEEN